MNTQGTKVHIRLWNREFWLMAISNLLLSMSITMLIPSLPLWLNLYVGMSNVEIGMVMGAFAVGLFLPGPFCSFLVQRYRRNVVFFVSSLFLSITMILPLLSKELDISLWVAVLWRIVQGAAFGLSQMVLTSTLIVDTCESHQRTEANHTATWFGRFALSLGPMCSLLLMQLPSTLFPSINQTSLSSLNVFFISAVLSMVAVLLVMFINFPFRVPEDNYHVMSFDRFFLTSGWPLFINLILITISAGLLLSVPVSLDAYGTVMVGFLLALLAQRFVFRDAELKSEVVSGLILMGSSLIILLTASFSPLTAPLLGLGLGIVGARFLLFFIKLSRHCQRGTSQSTFMLGWESGLAIGIAVGYGFFANNYKWMLLTSLFLVVLALVIYVCLIHKWFVIHKNR